MNLNDYRINAYKAASNNSEKKTEVSPKIQKPVFEHISKIKAPEPVTHNTTPKTFLSQQSAAQQIQGFKKQTKPVYAGPTDDDVKAAASVLTSRGLIKVPEKPMQSNGSENVYRRVAKFLLIIGVDEAAKILPHLTEKQTERIIPEIASIRHVDNDEATSILAEFQALVEQAKESGGAETAKTILEKAFGEQKATQMMEKAMPHQEEEKPFTYLDDMDTDRILLLLKDESTPTRALVLSYLQPKTAATVINTLPADEKKELILRLAKMQAISPEILHRVNQSMYEKAMAISTERANIIDGSSILAEILKRMPVKTEHDILSNLTDDDPDLGQNLRQKLFTIQDVIDADDRAIQDELRKMTVNDIAILIVGKPEPFRNKILHNVSIGRGDEILEQEQLVIPVKKSNSEAITSLFFSHLRQKYEEGQLYIKNRNDDIFV
ncbi:MAG: flagellar motor switch protein FliG [Treponema sp.]|nr:flagellar motor switch protein FliG [Treponema sp.]